MVSWPRDACETLLLLMAAVLIGRFDRRDESGIRARRIAGTAVVVADGRAHGID